LPACFASRVAFLPHQLPSLIKEGSISSVLDVEDASVMLLCWRGTSTSWG
jgi:hypothetical protein